MAKFQQIRQTAFNYQSPSGEWKPFKTRLSKPKSALPFTLRHWQEEFSKVINQNSLWKLRAPTGSGKSTAVINYIVNNIKNHNFKVLILVPQRIIGMSWNKPQKISGYNWNTQHNLCKDSHDKIKELTTFLSSYVSPDLNDRVCICTYSTAIGAFKANKSLFNKNLMIIVDEFHHLMFEQFIDSDLGNPNSLHEMIDYTLSRKNNVVGLASATDWRTDQNFLIKKKFTSRLVSYTLEFERYLEECCEHLKGIRCDNIYTDSFYNSLKSLRDELTEPTIIYIPHVHSHNTTGKQNDFNLVCKALCGTVNDDSYVKALFKINGKTVLNMVNDDAEVRKEIREILKKPPHIDYIIALEMAKEGFDHPSLKNVIVLGQCNSMLKVIQCLGRALRDYKDKKEANLFYITRMTFATMDIENQKSDFNNFMSTFVQALLIEDYYNPICIKENNRDDKITESVVAGNKIEISDDLLSSIISEVLILDESIKNNNDKLKKEVDDIVAQFVDENIESYQNYIWGLLSRVNKKKSDINIDGCSLEELFRYFKCYDINVLKKIRKYCVNTNKRELLRLARSDEKRPSQKTKLGKLLSAYTNMSSGSYDSKFNNDIRHINPSCFNSAKRKKQLLLKMIRRHEKRPLKSTDIGRALSSYTSRSHKCYDSHFDCLIKSEDALLGTRWWVDTSAEKKDILLKMMYRGEKKPSRKTKLGSCFYTYTHHKYSQFDKIFYRKVINFGTWLSRNIKYENDIDILYKLASESQPKPARRSRLGNLLDYLVRRKPDIFRRLRTANASWFDSDQGYKNGVLRRKGLL